MASKEVQDVDLSVNRNLQHSQSQFLSTSGVKPKTIKKKKVQSILLMEEDMRLMTVTPQLMVSIEAIIVPSLPGASIHLIHVNQRLILIVTVIKIITITITLIVIKLPIPPLFPLLQKNRLILNRQLSYPIDSIQKGKSYQKRKMTRL